MKKILLSALIYLLISINTFSQNAYYDALFCASLDTADANHNNYQSFSFNGGDKVVLSNFKLFLEKPFEPGKPNFERVKGIFQKIKASEQISDRASGLAGLELVSLLAPIFNLSKMSSGQTDTLLYGLTIYLADEFRKGYMQTYMNGIEKSIGKTGELRILFPQTYQKLLTLDPLKYQDFGNEMKSVFDEDLGNSLENLTKHIDKPIIEKDVNYVLDKALCEAINKNSYYPYFSLTSTIGQKLINGVHPSDIMGYLDEKYYKDNDTVKKKIGNQIHFLNILQRNLRDTSTRQNNQFSNVWLNFEKLSKLNNPNAMKYFIALILKEDEEFFKSKIDSLKDGKLIEKNLFNKYKKENITPLLSILTKLDELTKLKDKSLLEEKNFAMYLKNVGEIVELLATNTNKAEQVDKIMNITNNVFQTYNAIRVKNYSNLPVYLSNILSNFDSSKNSELANRFKKIDNFSSFSAGIVSAKTSQDVNKVIKNYVASPATFTEKREVGFKINVNAMPGIKYDFENTTLLKKDKTDSVSVTGQNIGLSLPVGIDFTLFSCSKVSYGLFVQAIDLGAMLNYRLTSNANTLPDSVGFKSVLSPGVSLSVGLPNTPLTIQLGYHWGPVLRNITDGKTVLASNTNTGSVHIRIAYDIPLFKIKGRKNVQDL